MSLQYELFYISSLPQSQLSKKERELFDFYVDSSEQYACQGSLKLALLDDTPEVVLTALTSSENGFKISNDCDGKSYLDWSTPHSKTLAMKMYEIATNPYSQLSESEKLEYETLKHSCFATANVGEKFIRIPQKTSPKVLDALGIPKNTEFFYWGSPN